MFQDVQWCRALSGSVPESLPIGGGKGVEQIFPVLLILAVIALGVGSIVWHFSRSEALLQRWAERNDFRLLKQEYCWFFKGPFFWTSSRGQTLYYVTIVDDAGHRRHAWVRCGGWFLGLLSDHVDVSWDD
jgi:hypothetical protein